MSEEILKALMHLFALIVKQDGGMLPNEREYVQLFLKKQLSPESVPEYLNLFDKNSGPLLNSAEENEDTPPSVKDSVKIFGICKQINRTLNQTQKVIVLLRLIELVHSDNKYTAQRLNIINTVAEVFRIDRKEYKNIDEYIKINLDTDSTNNMILSIDHTCNCFGFTKDEIETSKDDHIFVLYVESVDLYFVKHYSKNQLYLNGLPLTIGKAYTIAKGSSLRYAQGKPIYYSDIASQYLSGKDFNPISLVADNLRVVFPGNQPGLNKVSLAEKEGTLLGVMGSSGAGKTTLLNVLNGTLKPDEGTVRLNNIDVFNSGGSLKGVVGFVPQDDMLIEDLSVFQNLYYAASLCFRDKSKEELTLITDSLLNSIGLIEKRDLKVGSPLNKVISGGQRKRLNIALELIREPSVLYLDEPTSGLSSRDSENVMDLLRELTFKGKLVVTVIHQPSSEIYKMFDSMLILDKGGEMVYYGNPVEALIHFKTIDSQINSNIGECPTCGNINPETIFNIIETEVVDEFGKYTGVRKMSPSAWAEEYRENKPQTEVEPVDVPPPSNLHTPGPLKQLLIFAKRDIRSKLANRQYVYLTLLEAPVLSFLLSYLIKYIADPGSNIYIFRENENIPIYIFMTLIVALFLGLVTSAEEIFRDRKILKREQFLNLSRKSYLLSKIFVLFSISALQAFLFIIIANSILGIKGLSLSYWLAFFTTAACANLIGLNISSAFNSAITIYIVVPLIMIPMMVLSGAMFPFDKLNRKVGSVGRVPVIAEIMPTKWTYEALMVTQAKDNEYDRLVYEYDRQINNAYFMASRRLPALQDSLKIAVRAYREKELNHDYPANLPLLKNEIQYLSSTGIIEPFKNTDNINIENFNHLLAEEITQFINTAIENYNASANSAEIKKDIFINTNREALNILWDNYHNQKLTEIVKKVYETNKLLEYRDHFIQNYDPIYLYPEIKGPLSFRTHFLSPVKPFFGRYMATFTFNIVFVWLMSLVLYLMLFYDVLKYFTGFFKVKN